MNSFSQAKSLSASVRLYRALLVAYPKKFREHYETQMVQVFRDSYRDAYLGNGLPGLMDLWFHTFADLLVTALVERMMERSQVMFSPRVILWGGVASLFGGLFWILAWIPSDNYGWLLALSGLVLALGGLAGLYSQQAGRGGRLGLAGFLLGSIATVLTVAALLSGIPFRGSSELSGNPASVAAPSLIFALELLALGVGLVLLGVSGLRGNALRHWRGFPLVLGLLHILGGLAVWLVFYLPLSQGRDPWHDWILIAGHTVYHRVLWPNLAVLLGLGWMALGILLTAEASAARVAQPPPAAA